MVFLVSQNRRDIRSSKTNVSLTSVGIFLLDRKLAGLHVYFYVSKKCNLNAKKLWHLIPV